MYTFVHIYICLHLYVYLFDRPRARAPPARGAQARPPPGAEDHRLPDWGWRHVIPYYIITYYGIILCKLGAITCLMLLV